MVNRHTAKKIRLTHRYLGIFIGLQFLIWTAGGLYFSWTDLDEIHGDHLRSEQRTDRSFVNLVAPSSLQPPVEVKNLELKEIAGMPHYWVNNNLLYNAISGFHRSSITEEEALLIAKENMASNLEVKGISLITETGPHHEYRGKLLPAFVISYENPGAIKAYVSAIDGSFRSVRHREWRWFDFLWMTHTMDYEGRDDFNNWLLRVFSVLGLVTVLSGFVLWFISSPSVKKMRK